MPPVDIQSVSTLYSAEEIAVRVDALAKDIAAAMPEDILVVAILKGGFVFAADLIRALHGAGMYPRVDFMTLSSYGAGKESSGKVSIARDISDDIQGADILLVDDILESGRTVAAARRLLLERGASSVKICMLLDKPGKRKVECEADFCGFVVPDLFVVGYGLDFAHYYRDLPYIGTVDD
ncbi:MAG: hypoxanthine phosphoribosyltransferase [Alphaproteobacteria bacterium]|jgi:hypoxanthine phosphoribosyltransferase